VPDPEAEVDRLLDTLVRQPHDAPGPTAGA